MYVPLTANYFLIEFDIWCLSQMQGESTATMSQGFGYTCPYMKIPEEYNICRFRTNSVCNIYRTAIYPPLLFLIQSAGIFTRLNIYKCFKHSKLRTVHWGT